MLQRIGPGFEIRQWLSDTVSLLSLRTHMASFIPNEDQNKENILLVYRHILLVYRHILQVYRHILLVYRHILLVYRHILQVCIHNTIYGIAYKSRIMAGKAFL